MDDASMLIGACPKRSIAWDREQIRQQVDRSRSNSRGRSILAKRVGRGIEIDTYDTMPFRPRAESVGFVDTPIGMDPATLLLPPRRLSDLGAAGGSMVELSLPPPWMTGKEKQWTGCTRRPWTSTTPSVPTTETTPKTTKLILLDSLLQENWWI